MTDKEQTPEKTPELLQRSDPTLILDAITTGAAVAGVGLQIADRLHKDKPASPQQPESTETTDKQGTWVSAV